MHAHIYPHTGLHKCVKWEESPRGACWSKLALDVSLSALNTNMQQYNWIIGAIISVAVSFLLFRAVTLTQTERLCVSIKTYKTCEVAQPLGVIASLPGCKFYPHNEFPLCLYAFDKKTPSFITNKWYWLWEISENIDTSNNNTFLYILEILQKWFESPNS